MAEEKKRRTTFEQNPELKTMAYMIAHGASIAEIAKTFKITEKKAKLLSKSTSMRRAVDKVQAQIYGNPSQRIKAILPEAIETSYGIMKDENVKPSVRQGAAKNFIEQGLGKPKQTVDMTGGFTIRNLFERLDQARLPSADSEPVPIEVESIEELPPAEPQSEVDEFMKEFEKETANEK